MWIKLNAYYRLGLGNLARVFVYKLKLKSGLLRQLTPVCNPVTGPFWVTPSEKSGQRGHHQPTHQFPLFGWINVNLDSVPNWHKSVLNEQSLATNNQHWSHISDFDSGVGDIKGIWELSRFSWVITLARNYLATGDQKYLQRLNVWVQDWSLHNPANQGANWKCAQEASLRVLHLAAGSLLIQTIKPELSLLILIEQHLRRILPTMGYAIGQDNNHGTSEAAALYVGGSWLLHNEHETDFAQLCMKKGLQMLVNRGQRLIMHDGCFSQYSVTYHRLMLDTFSFVELWRRHLDLPLLPKRLLQQLQKAAYWLFCMTDTESGDAPNLGTNDGAHILNYSHAPYRDFRPSVELAAQLFLNQSCFDSPACEDVKALFGLNAKDVLDKPTSHQFSTGGFGLLRQNRVWCLLRVPHFLFRPAQADNHHLDLWVGGVNVLRDGGSFSYNTEQHWIDYFSGCQSHNCIEFDQRAQMPKVSRFLFGQWPTFNLFKQTDDSIISEYQDWRGVTHHRSVKLACDSLIVEDQFLGVRSRARLRWRLCPDVGWEIKDNRVISEDFSLQLLSDRPIIRFDIAQGAESRYYGEKAALPVLEVDVASDATIKTIINWHTVIRK